MNKISGIYQIQSKIHPERIYIGSAVNVNQRRNEHLYRLRYNKHHSKKLQRHYNKYGKDDLTFSVLIECEKHQLIQFEQYYLDFYRPYFNGCQTAGSAMLGRQLSEEHKRKISQSNKGHIAWNKGRKDLPKGHKYNLGRHPSEETKRKMSMSAKGKSKSKEHCLNISRSKKGQVSLFKGRHHSEESKLIMRNIKLGKKQSEETINKRRKYLIGNKFACGNISGRGRKLSEETKRKMSESRKGILPWNIKPVMQYDLLGVFIREWDSATYAAKELLINRSNINACLLNKYKQANGYIWRYK